MLNTQQLKNPFVVENKKTHCTTCNLRTYKTIEKKDGKWVKNYTCTKCKNNFCGSHIYSYVDESNIAISKNSLKYCKNCYIKIYA